MFEICLCGGDADAGQAVVRSRGASRINRAQLVEIRRQIGLAHGVGGWIAAGQMRARDWKLQPVWGSCEGASWECERVTVAWAGAQAVVYAVGSFTHGMQVGVDASWMQLWLTQTEGSVGQEYARAKGLSGLPDTHGSAGALTTAFVLGYKYVASYGLTFNPQIAAGPVVATTGDVFLLPRVSLNAGWTF
jgi:hypothetical protein